MTILILGGEDDEHAVHMLRHLRGRRHDAELLDSRDFPERLRIRFDPREASGAIRLPGGRVLGFREVASVYWRSYAGTGESALPDPGQAFLAANDARSLFESLLVRLPARWVNGWSAYQSHQTKPAQLAAVAALGVSVPATLLSNDPEAVLEFARMTGRCVFKPVQGGAHARRLTAAHLDPANLASLAHAPVTLQEEVPGTNVRTFVAGRRVLACEIRTPEVDYRDDPRPEIVRHDLPPEAEAASLRVADALGLLWAGIDWRLEPEGRYVFLEANPSPMFLGFEAATGMPLTESLAAVLVGDG